MSVTNSAWKHIMEHVLRMPRKCHIFFLKFVTFVTFKVPSDLPHRRAGMASREKFSLPVPRLVEVIVVEEVDSEVVLEV